MRSHFIEAYLQCTTYIAHYQLTHHRKHLPIMHLLLQLILHTSNCTPHFFTQVAHLVLAYHKLCTSLAHPHKCNSSTQHNLQFCTLNLFFCTLCTCTQLSSAYPTHHQLRTLPPLNFNSCTSSMTTCANYFLPIFNLVYSNILTHFFKSLFPLLKDRQQLKNSLFKQTTNNPKTNLNTNNFFYFKKLHFIYFIRTLYKLFV